MTASINGREAWSLGPGEVHLWTADLDLAAGKDLADGLPLLSDDETERARRMRDPRARRRFVAGRRLLRTLVGGYAGAEPREVVFAYETFGKPRLAAPRGHAPVSFNLAHSAEVALFAVTGAGAIGVDVEHIRAIPEADEIADAYFTEFERNRLRALPKDRRPAAFMRSWTRLEAALKASGWGWSGLEIAAEPPEIPPFSICEIEAPPGCAAALALARPCRQIVRRVWDESVLKPPDRFLRTG